MDPSQMLPRSFPMWPPSDAAPPQPQLPFLPPPNANRGWKRKNNPNSGGGYHPPAIADLQVQNRAKARRWFKNHNPNNNNNNRKYFFPNHKPRAAAAAPRNTTSFIIRAKRAGGIASLVSPCPVTPAVLPTPRLSPTREGLSDMAQQQWGVDGYGSMKGLIRLRSSPQAAPNAAAAAAAVSDDDEEENSSGSDVEEHVEVERRLDHDLSRFEMVYPGRGDEAGGYVFEEDEEYDQDVHVARLEEENLTLKERLFLMEQEVGDMRRRLEVLEARFSEPSADAVGGGGGENAAAEQALDDATAGEDEAVKNAPTGEEALENAGIERDNVAAAGGESAGEDEAVKNAPTGEEALENAGFERENGTAGGAENAGEDEAVKNAPSGEEALENAGIERDNVAAAGAESAGEDEAVKNAPTGEEALENGNATAGVENDDIGMDDVEAEKKNAAVTGDAASGEEKKQD